jgi:uncharacterized protein YcgI (DUF1989 family)
MNQTVVPAREGRAVIARTGQHIRITTPQGGQAADFFAYNMVSIAEWLSAPHSWVTEFSIKPRQGYVFRSRFRRPMLRITEDGANGVHDMMIAACDQYRYEFFGHQGPHPSCSENLALAMRRIGYQIDVVPQPINFFTNTRIDTDGKLLSPPNPVPPGAYVEMEALMDVICVISSCPFDLHLQGWTINAGREPTDLLVGVSG